MKIVACLLCLLLFCQLVHGLDSSQFYPHGEILGDRKVTNGDEISTDEIKLRVPFLFYGESYSSYYVSEGRKSFINTYLISLNKQRKFIYLKSFIGVQKIEIT